jgi:hypothetical protein
MCSRHARGTNAFYSGGSALDLSAITRIEILGPGLTGPLHIESDSGFFGSVLVSGHELTSEFVERIEFHPMASNSSPEVAQRVLHTVTSHLSHSSCVMVSADAIVKTDASKPIPTVSDLHEALGNGRMWWRDWSYECGEVLTVVSLEKDPLRDPENPNGFYMRIYFERSPSLTPKH